MVDPYIAPYLINGDWSSLPEGTFILPVCTNRERFAKIMDALFYAGANQSREPNYDHLIDVLDAISRVRAGCEFDVTDNCTAIFPDDPRIEWLPESPYNPLPDVPDGYAFHPFTIVDSSIISQIIAQFGLGYKIGDVFTDLTKIPLGTSWEDIFNGEYLNFPRMRITGLVGRGTVKLHLLNIRAGGRILVNINGVVYLNPYQNNLVETTMDWLAFPPETRVDQVIEIDVEQSGTNFVDVVWLPVVDNDFIPVGYGAGIRYIELCGFDMPQIDPCCPDEKRYLKQIFQQNNYYMSYVYNIMDDGENPQSFVPDAPENYDSNPDDTNPTARTRALCAAVTRYVWNVLTAIVENYATADFVGDILENMPQFGIIVGLVDAVIDIAADAVADLVNDTEAVNDVICHMLANLSGQPVTQAAFRDSVEPTAFTPLSNQWQIAVFLDIANASKDNWRAFTAALPSIYESISQGGSVDCPCDCEDDIELIDWYGTGTIITPVGDCIYRFEQLNPIFETPPDVPRWYHSVRDSLGRCILVEASPNPSYPTEASSDYWQTLCDGTDINGVGGGGGGVLKMRWRGNPITHYKITLVD